MSTSRGGHINLEAVEDFITALGQRYRVREVVYDPAFFARSAEILSARGLTVASLDQRSAPMREAWSQFYEAVNASALAHEGDAILTAHVLNAAAHVDPSGHWKVRKIKQSHKIDGLVASRDRLLPRCASSGQADGRVRLGLVLDFRLE